MSVGFKMAFCGSAREQSAGLSAGEVAPPQEGRSAKRFRDSLKKAAGYVCNSLRYSKFSRMLPELHKENPAVCHKIHQAITKSLRVEFEKEISAVIEEEHMVEKLNQLDAMTEKAKAAGNQRQWRPNGDPYQAQIAYDMQMKLKMKAEWERSIQQQKAELLALKEKVLDGRRRLVAIHEFTVASRDESLLNTGIEILQEKTEEEME